MKKRTKIFLLAIPAVFLPVFLFFGFSRSSSSSRKIIFEKKEEAFSETGKEKKIPEEFEVKIEQNNLSNTEENLEIENQKKEIKKESEVSKGAEIKNNLVSWGFSNANGRKIDTIIIHSSYNALGGEEYDVKKLLAEYKEYGVAPHYLIDRQGKTYRLVDDKNVAWHAGESKTPDGRKNVNDFSIGIELINTKTDKYTSEQYAALSELLDYLKEKYKIKYTLGHKDIAPGRKDDPWNLEWDKIKR